MSNTTKSMLKKSLLPVAIIAITVVAILLITKNPPKNNRAKPAHSNKITVQIQKILPISYQIMIQSFGTVQPRTQSVLFSQVSGQINYVSQQFRAGGFFEKGDVLVQVDERDHRADVNIAKASLLSANQALQEEIARGEQAATDWQRLGKGKVANALVLRQPQLAAVKAQLMSAQAQLNKAMLSLERTKIIAPYSGRVLQKNVDIGQVISSNTQLADIYAADTVEVRLPIKNKDLPLISLPEEYRYRHELSPEDDINNRVIFSSDLMGKQAWQGHIIRTESAIDSASQQLYVVGQIDSPFEQSLGQSSQIKIGQYVSAEITGKQLTNVIVIPTSTIYQGSYVYIVENNLLMRREIQLGWQNGLEAIVIKGITAGDELVLTPLGQVSSGTSVEIEGQPRKEGKAGKHLSKDKKHMPSPDKLEKMATENSIGVATLPRNANKVEQQ